MERPEGKSTNIGNIVLATFLDNDQSTPQRMVGRVLREYPAGMDLVDERSGDIHRVNANFGKILSVHVEPLDAEWKRARQPTALIDAIKETTNPYASIEIAEDIWGTRSTVVYGKVSLEDEEDRDLVTVIDSMGNRHQFEPQLVHFTAHITEGAQQTTSIFPSHAKETIHIVDHRKTDRQHLAQELHSSGQVFDNPAYYDYFAGDIDDTKRLIKRWFKRGGSRLIASVSSSTESMATRGQ